MKLLKTRRTLFITLIAAAVIAVGLWYLVKPETETLRADLFAKEKQYGRAVWEDLTRLPSLAIASGEIDAENPKKKSYLIEDDNKIGIEITTASSGESDFVLAGEEEKTGLMIVMPAIIKPKQGEASDKSESNADSDSSFEVKLAENRSVFITPLGQDEFSSDLLKRETTEENLPGDDEYVRYRTKDWRITQYYGYQKDQSLGERLLKNWLVYEHGDGREEMSYGFRNAKIRINSKGDAEVYYHEKLNAESQPDLKEVDNDLMARAQRTLAAEFAKEIDEGNVAPDFTIPRPFYIDNAGEKVFLNWEYDEAGNLISFVIDADKESYPLAVDPTLMFSAPGQAGSGSAITGETTSSSFGTAFAAGDFNSDGRTDLAVGAYLYNSNQGRVYVFYNNGQIPTDAASADVVITGDANSRFGCDLSAGDMNSDGREDLIVGALYAVKTYIFYNDGEFPTAAASADIIITGTANSAFGDAVATGDFNSDGRIDLAVGARNYSTIGRTYIFYNDGQIPTTVASADVTIDGEAGLNFGYSLAAGDFNSDGRTDLAVGAYTYGSYQGRVYIFHNDGQIPTTAAAADIIIDGEASTMFGYALAAGDFNSDGRTDLAVGAYYYSSSQGRAYIFYNDGLIPTTAATADVIISGEAGSHFGNALAAGDFNSDGRTDLAISANYYNTNQGRTYIFYNNDSYSTSTLAADVIINGEASSYFGTALISGDFNSDGRTDLAVGASTYSTSRGRAYIFYSQNGMIDKGSDITSVEGGTYTFGTALATGDLNSDGRMDLVVGAGALKGFVYIFYSNGNFPETTASADAKIMGPTNGRFGISLAVGDFNSDGFIDIASGAWGVISVYIFYNNNNQWPSTATSADVIITGEGIATAYFGSVMSAGDLNSDGQTDLAVGAYAVNSSKGRVYIFYNDGQYPQSATLADVIISAEVSSYFGHSILIADLNSDNKDDLIVGASSYDRTYVFYNDGSYPATSTNADLIIVGEASSYFGRSLAAGDFDSDGSIDLAVGAPTYNSSSGQVYIFYNDGSIPTTAASADVVISNESTSQFGIKMSAGDLNSDGRTDLVVGAIQYSSYTGSVYIFNNDGQYPTTAATADMILIGGTLGEQFGFPLLCSDLNSDSQMDLIIGAKAYNSNTGRIYIFYGQPSFAWEIQGLYPDAEIAANGGAKMVVKGEFASGFGYSVASGDFNFNGRTDIAVGAPAYNSDQGKAYIFYSDGYLQSTAETADIEITGEAGSRFGETLSAGDFDRNGRIDLAVGAPAYNSNQGRAYIFRNDGSLPTTAAAADTIFTGESASEFGSSLIAGNFNRDSYTDLAVGAPAYNSSQGRAYIFNAPYAASVSAAIASTTITGEENSEFGSALAVGDFNRDSYEDLAVGAPIYNSSQGRAYIFNAPYSATISAAIASSTITGETASGFGTALAAGNLNNDVYPDLAVGAPVYNSSQGRAYIFNAPYSATISAAIASSTITGENASQFGRSLAISDYDLDSTADLAVGAPAYAADRGKIYVFMGYSTYPASAVSADVKIVNQEPGQAGFSLASGDYNMDGKADLMIGAPTASSSAGELHVYTFNDSVSIGDTDSDFGYSLAAGDFNLDGRIDLAAGAPAYNSDQGRVYVFLNYPDYGLGFSRSTSSANAVIDGEAGSRFGYSLAAGDFYTGSSTDLAVGAPGYSSDSGRVYLFKYNSAFATTSINADSIITGEAASRFGVSLVASDLNRDSKMDIAVGADGYNSDQGRVYAFLSPFSASISATAASTTITGEAASRFGYALSSGDYNRNSYPDLAVGAPAYNSNQGRVYVFNPPLAAILSATAASTTITGETGGKFGSAIASGDFNFDGITDMWVGAPEISGNRGKIYLFNSLYAGSWDADTASSTITGSYAGDFFGIALAGGDFNSDSRFDAAVGSLNSNFSQYGTVRLFYNDDSYPTYATGSELSITGAAANSYFGRALAAADFNTDSIIDLAIGAYNHNSGQGAVYVYAMENREFDSLHLPEVQTASSTILTVSSARLYGNVVSSGDNHNIRKGFKYGTDPDCSQDLSDVSALVAATSTGYYNFDITGLSSTTHYYFQSYVTNAIGTSRGECLSFSILPVINTLAPSSVGTSTAVFNADIVNSGGASSTVRGFKYGTNPVCAANTSNLSESGTFGNGTYDLSVSELTPITIYYVRAYATNTYGTNYGNCVEFDTGVSSVFRLKAGVRIKEGVNLR